MERKELYETIKDRNVAVLFRNLELQLAQMSPSGDSVHTRDSLRQVLISTIKHYDLGYFPQEETVQAYLERDSRLCDEAIDKILDEVNKCKLKV